RSATAAGRQRCDATNPPNDRPMQTQRMILWIVFSMSLLFLWDAWQRHEGRPSLFGGASQQASAPAGAAGGPAAPPADASIPPPTVAPPDANRTEVPGAQAPAGATGAPAA